jgi:hypothetical protein
MVMGKGHRGDGEIVLDCSMKVGNKSCQAAQAHFRKAGLSGTVPQEKKGGHEPLGRN